MKSNVSGLTGSSELVLTKAAQVPAKALVISSRSHPSALTTSTPASASLLLDSEAGWRLMARTWKPEVLSASKDSATAPAWLPVPKTVTTLLVVGIMMEYGV